MLDPKRLRFEPERVREQLARRGYSFDLEKFLDLESRRKTLQTETEKLQANRNERARAIGIAKGKGEDIKEQLQENSQLKLRLDANTEALARLQGELDDFLLSVPNIPHGSVPDGKDETQNVEVRRWGKPRPSLGVKDHVDLGEALKQMDFAAAAKISGARFVVLRRELARLHRALIQLMLDMHTREHGYEEVYVPYMVNSASLQGTGQLPKFASDQFRVQGEQDLWLIPTAEVPVTNLLRDEIVPFEQLPKKFVCHTPCFRAEAGAAGKDTRGMIRQHQFEKVELVQAVAPEHSHDALEELARHAENVLRRLELPYRVVSLCAGDIGFSAAKTYDLEVWMPSQDRYREISSCSNFEDFQARRMLARYRRSATDKPETLHTLNGSGLAVGRTLVAIIENFQDTSGLIAVPAALQPYLDGLKRIG
ncbi:MAG TPA: serine--tRNA ligase [Verrucomicrobiae bacterium]|nr:serine--tRNA ligase [Verrucomicrobiae bacterium]